MTSMLLAGLVITLAGCGGNTGNEGELSGSINIIGSNTVTPLTLVWAEEFMKMHPEVRIAVSGPGSGAGIAVLINGITDICQASGKMKSKEIDQGRTDMASFHDGISSASSTVSILSGTPP